MATFTSSLTSSLGSTPQTIYTLSGASSAELIGVNLANTSPGSPIGYAPINVSVQLVRTPMVGSPQRFMLAQNLRIPPGSAQAVAGGEMKMVLQNGDVLQASCDPPGYCDAIVSSLENTDSVIG